MSDGIIPLTPAQTATQEARAEQEEYLKRALIGLDMFVNVLTDGDPDETISSRSARAAERGRRWGIVMSKFLDIFQHNHGAKAQAGDVARAQYVIAVEDASGGIPK
jgi:hypothetical protein